MTSVKLVMEGLPKILTVNVSCFIKTKFHCYIFLEQ